MTGRGRRTARCGSRCSRLCTSCARWSTRTLQRARSSSRSCRRSLASSPTRPPQCSIFTWRTSSCPCRPCRSPSRRPSLSRRPPPSCSMIRRRGWHRVVVTSMSYSLVEVVGEAGAPVLAAVEGVWSSSSLIRFLPARHTISKLVLVAPVALVLLTGLLGPAAVNRALPPPAALLCVLLAVEGVAATVPRLAKMAVPAAEASTEPTVEVESNHPSLATLASTAMGTEVAPELGARPGTPVVEAVPAVRGRAVRTLHAVRVDQGTSPASQGVVPAMPVEGEVVLMTRLAQQQRQAVWVAVAWAESPVGRILEKTGKTGSVEGAAVDPQPATMVEAAATVARELLS
mmetsp:Transcript_26596/g.73032  ORF Transcript_26596/g.73032 Transcript_26596/m.73032 type:complete len:344 (-) Transcript_26596:1421-2452(-)